MNSRDKIANFLCLFIATATFAAIFHSHILYVAHHNSTHTENAPQEIYLSHPSPEHFPSISGGIGYRGQAPSHEQ